MLTPNYWADIYDERRDVSHPIIYVPAQRRIIKREPFYVVFAYPQYNAEVPEITAEALLNYVLETIELLYLPQCALVLQHDSMRGVWQLSVCAFVAFPKTAQIIAR